MSNEMSKQMNSIFRLLAIVASLPLLGLGAGAMFAPQSMYQLLDLTPNGVYGINTIRSDIGGLLISSAIMIWIGIGKNNSTWLASAMLVMGTLLTGRVISTILDGFSNAAIPAFVVETLVIVILYLNVQRLKVAEAPRQSK